MFAMKFFAAVHSSGKTYAVNERLKARSRFLVAIRHGLAWISLASSLFCVAQAQTAKEPWEELDKRVNASENIAPLGNDLFGDKVGLERGELSFSNTDVSLPGNNTLPVAITRTLAVNVRRGYRNDAMAADWDIDLPSISGVFAPDWVTNSGSTNRCAITSYTTASPPAVTSVCSSNPTTTGKA